MRLGNPTIAAKEEAPSSGNDATEMAFGSLVHEDAVLKKSYIPHTLGELHDPGCAFAVERLA